jgi:hypothetical protein
LQHAAEKGVAPDTPGRNATQKKVAPGRNVDLDTPPFGEPPKLFYTGVESGLAGVTDASIQIRRFQLVELAHLCVCCDHEVVVKHTRTHARTTPETVQRKKTKLKGTNEHTNQELKHTISSGHGISSGNSQAAPVREFLNPFPTALRMISMQAL